MFGFGLRNICLFFFFSRGAQRALLLGRDFFSSAFLVCFFIHNFLRVSGGLQAFLLNTRPKDFLGPQITKFGGHPVIAGKLFLF